MEFFSASERLTIQQDLPLTSNRCNTLWCSRVNCQQSISGGNELFSDLALFRPVEANFCILQILDLCWKNGSRIPVNLPIRHQFRWVGDINDIKVTGLRKDAYLFCENSNSIIPVELYTYSLILKKVVHQ